MNPSNPNRKWPVIAYLVVARHDPTKSLIESGPSLLSSGPSWPESLIESDQLLYHLLIISLRHCRVRIESGPYCSVMARHEPTESLFESDPSLLSSGPRALARGAKRPEPTRAAVYCFWLKYTDEYKFVEGVVDEWIRRWKISVGLWHWWITTLMKSAVSEREWWRSLYEKILSKRY